jgi:hypothetical protein
MPLPPEKRIRFFVFVIESPSPVDLYHRRSEGEIILQALNLNQIDCIVKTAVNFEAFEACLKIGLKESMDFLTDKLPILHISAHGNSNGLQLSSGETIDWSNLRQLLAPINQALNNNLLVCLSCCEGYSGTRMAMFVEDQGYPFYGIVANSENPVWSETAVAYLTFYHLVAKGEDLVDAVNAMRIASGNKYFFFETAEDARKGFLDYLNKTDPQQVRNRLEQTMLSEPPNHLAKLRKIGIE